MKKFILILSLIFVSVPVMAQNDQFYTLEDFSKGMKSHVSDYLIDDGAAVQSQNVRLNEEYGDIAKRQKRLILSNCHLAAVKSLYRYYLSDATKHTIATSSTYVDAIDNNGTCTALYSTATDGKRWSFITYKDKLIGMNGTDNAKKWDGSVVSSSDTLGTDGARTAGDLATDLGAPFAEQNTGSNLDASSWYQYKVAFFDTDTGIYHFSNARSNPIQTGSTVRDITLTDIPLGVSGTDWRIIYGTEGKASRADVVAETDFYRVTTITDNSTQTYNVAIADTLLLLDSAPTWSTASGGINVTPPKSKFSVINQERLFVANDPSGTDSGKSTVYWSDILNPDYFNYLTDYELIRPDDGDEITFIKNQLGKLTIGKQRSISKFYTEGATTSWSLSDPYSFIGCDSPWSAVNGLSGIIYLGRYGVYMFGGQSSELISDVVTDKIRDILETNRDEVAGIYHDNTYYLAYTSADSGAANNDRVLVFDITRNSYAEDTSHIDSFASYDSGDDSGTLYSGSSETDGSIYAHSLGFERLIYRYKSQFELGTATSTYVGGTEDNPTVTLGDDETWAASGATTWDGSGSATWLFDSQTGTWVSPIIQINAANLDKLYWNEDLGSAGSITWAVSTGDTTGGMSAYSSEVSDPSGSDVSGTDGKVYIQLRASLSSTSWTETPELFLEDNFVFKLSYKKSGNQAEPSYLSLWQGGKANLGTDNPKRIKEIQVFYSGTSGTMTVAYDDESGTTRDFDIDLSVDPADSATDEYFGTTDDKIFVYIPPFTDQPVGRVWQFQVTEDGTEEWKVKRILTRFEALPYQTYQGTL